MMSTQHSQDHFPMIVPSRPVLKSGSHRQIEKFTGKIEKYVEFWKQFSVIHLDMSLTNTRKFCNLRTLLKDDALVTISHLLVSDENYDVAIKLLHKKYNYEQDVEFANLFTKLERVPFAYKTTAFFIVKNIVNAMDAIFADLEAIGEKINDLLKSMYTERLLGWLQPDNIKTTPFAEFRKFVYEKLNSEALHMIRPWSSMLVPSDMNANPNLYSFTNEVHRFDNYYHERYTSNMNRGTFLNGHSYSDGVNALGKTVYGPIGSFVQPIPSIGTPYEIPHCQKVSNDDVFTPAQTLSSPRFDESFHNKVNVESKPSKNDCVFCDNYSNSEDRHVVWNFNDQMKSSVKHHYCLQCLSNTHSTSQCLNKENCRKCGKSYHRSVLCLSCLTSPDEVNHSESTSSSPFVKENIVSQVNETSTVQSLWIQFDATNLVLGNLFDTDEVVRRMELILSHLQALGEDVDSLDVKQRYVDRLPPWIAHNNSLVNKKFALSTIRSKVKNYVQRLKNRKKLLIKNATVKVESVKSTDADSELCIYCSEPHSSTDCSTLISTKQRFMFLQDSGRCTICTELHEGKRCLEKSKCPSCGKMNHHASLCYFRNNTKKACGKKRSRFDKNKSTPTYSNSTTSDETVSQVCVFCGTHINSIECPIVQSKSMRCLTLKRENRCYLCLQKHLLFENCDSRVQCFYCHKTGHHASLCFRNPTLKVSNYKKGFCVFCHKHEFSCDCPEVTIIKERKELLTIMKRCPRCLKPHKSECKSTKKCWFCKSTDHHSALCEMNPIVETNHRKKIFSESDGEIEHFQSHELYDRVHNYKNSAFW